MRMVDMIIKKRDGYELSSEEIDFIINGYTNGLIPDYQMSAFLMAVYFNGMSDLESTSLTIAMLKSGDEIDLSQIKGIKVDKHSTGGVGDKTTLVLTPLIASLGINVAKMSGRGLGHTGGTLDKLESIRGFNINISNENFIKQVNEIGLAVIGQTGNLTPADKKMYALRDVSGTVNSIPLIASSIMSKKLASGADIIHLDVKVGSGAFMKNKEDALKLSRLMVNIGNNAKRKTSAVLTDMEQPLGYAIGNSLEVIEAIKTLNGNGPKDLTELCLEIGSHILLDAQKASSILEAKKMLIENINNKKGLEKLRQMVLYQGGDENCITNIDLFEKAKHIFQVNAQESGYIMHIDALEIGISAMLLGAGRETINDQIDPSVGIVLNKKVGDYVNKGEALAFIHSNYKNENEALKKCFNAFKIGDKEIHNPLIIDVVR